MINNILKGSFHVLTTNSNGSYSFQTIKQSRYNEVLVTPCKVLVKPYTRPYKCETCNSTFYSNHGLINHRSSPLHKKNATKNLAEDCIITAVIRPKTQHINKIKSKANLPQRKQKIPERSTTLCKTPSLIKCIKPRIPVIEIIDENDKLIAATSVKNKLVDLLASMKSNLEDGVFSASDIIEEMEEENDGLISKQTTTIEDVAQIIHSTANFQVDMLV